MSDQNPNLDQLKKWEKDLACPICLGSLRFDAAKVQCLACGVTYPVVDGIPVLIPQRAVRPVSG